jgi:hypothetical protein
MDDVLKIIGMITKLTQILEGFTPILNELIQKERERSGLTEDEIVARALATIDETDRITREDMQ